MFFNLAFGRWQQCIRRSLLFQLFHIYFTYILLIFYLYFTYISLSFHLYFTYILLLFDFNFTYISPLFHLYFTHISLLFYFYFTYISLVVHLYFTYISISITSLLFHLYFIPHEVLCLAKRSPPFSQVSILEEVLGVISMTSRWHVEICTDYRLTVPIRKRGTESLIWELQKTHNLLSVFMCQSWYCYGVYLVS